MWEGCATVPAFALVSHSHRRGLPGGGSKHGSAAELARKAHAGGSAHGCGGEAGEAEELQAEVARLRARLAQLEGLPAGEPAV